MWGGWLPSSTHHHPPASSSLPAPPACPACLPACPPQVMLYQFRFALLLATGLLIWETILKFQEPDGQYVSSDDEALITVNVVVACLCLAAVLAMGGLLLWRVRAGGWVGAAGGSIGHV